MSKKTANKKIDKSESIAVDSLNVPKCSTYGAFKLNNPACTACESKFAARQKACAELSKEKAVKKTVKIQTDKLDCFDANVSSDTHKFIMEIYKNPCTMKAIKACAWNNRPNTFYCKFGSLQKSGFAKKNKSGVLQLTSAGRKLLESWIESQKKIESELRKTG